MITNKVSNKLKLCLLITTELGAGMILGMAAVQTYPVKYSQQIQVDRFKGQISNPANVGSPFAPLLALMGLGCFGDGLRRFWKAFEEESNIPAPSNRKVNSPVEPELTFPTEPEPEVTEIKVQPEQPEQATKSTYKARPVTAKLPTKPVLQVQAESNLPRPVAVQINVNQPVQPQVKQMAKKKTKSVPTFDTDNFAGNKLSIVFAGAPRTGKSTSHLAWMAKKFEADPNVQFRIVTQKKNSFLGLDEVPGVVQVVSRTNSYVGLFHQAIDVWNELQSRLELPEDERESLSEYWLVLDDWFSIVFNLEKSQGKLRKCWENCKGQFADIITLGAEFGVGISANTHTLNLSHFGLADDSNIRSVLSICAMGRIHLDKSRKEGGFDAISNVIRNPYMIDEHYSSDLKRKFAHLRDYSIQTGFPVVLSTMGEPELNIMPDLSWIKTYKIPIDQGGVVQYFEKLIQVEHNGVQENDADWQETGYQDEEEELGNGGSYGGMPLSFSQDQSLDFDQNEEPQDETGEDDVEKEEYKDDGFDNDADEWGED
ncbi:MAG TPA: hypothetical protein VIQ31_34560 [Phormidium sp.]